MKNQVLWVGLICCFNGASAFAWKYDCTKQVHDIATNQTYTVSYSDKTPMPVEASETKRFVQTFSGSTSTPFSFQICDVQTSTCSRCDGSPVTRAELSTKDYDVVLSCTHWTNH